MASAPSPKKLKKADSTAHPELETKDFDSETQKYLDELDACQSEIETLNDNASEEILMVEQKYNLLRTPHFEKRTEIIDKIPNFWITAFNNHPDLSAPFNEADDDCFSHLTKLMVEEFEDVKSGYRINFHFEENPYFVNAVLTKEFRLAPSGNLTSTSTPILWKEGMDLLESNESSYTKSGLKRSLDQRSFFSWYNDHIDPNSDAIAEIIKDDLWHNPLQYYLLPDVDVNNGVDDEEEGEEMSNGEEDENEEVVRVEESLEAQNEEASE